MSILLFIRVVKRFVSRRGMPDQVISDNFKSFNSVEVKSYFVKNGVNCRPLVYTSSDDVHETLTPFHLMYGRNLTDHKLKEKQCIYSRID